MLLYDVRMALPRTCRNYGRSLFKKIDRDVRKQVKDEEDLQWLETYSLKSWNDARIEDIEKSMHDGHVFIIRDTNLNAAWDYNMDSGIKLKTGATRLDAQDFKNPNKANGIEHSKVPLSRLIYPEPDRVLNCLSLPQPKPVEELPRQRELDIGTLAIRARQEKLMFKMGPAEHELESGFHTGLNWAIISQKHAVSFGHVDTAGVYTGILILAGIKYWAIRKTAVKGREEMDVDDVEYFVDLNGRDLESLPGGAAAWMAVVLFPGDVLIIPPNARHAVFTITNSMMAGIHFYSHMQLQRSVCGWICTRFSTWKISNAEHYSFLSIQQSLATYYAPGFKKNHGLPASHPIIRTLPHPDPEVAEHGLPLLLALAVVLAFNYTLSAKFEPYVGVYYDSDRSMFKKIWTEATKGGYVKVSKTNLTHGDYQSILSKWINKNDVWDYRWTGAGIGEVIVHAARAITYLSIRWQDVHAPKKIPVIKDPRFPEEEWEALDEDDQKDREAKFCLSPEEIHRRATVDVASALGLTLEAAQALVGTIDDCVD
ncbi:hypothetical protein PENSPDRAFT_672680, partial [Peniophora sp. CONT]